MGASSDKSQQNQLAQDQIAQQKATALQSLQQYMQANPGPLAGAQAPAPPPQYSGQIPGQHFGPGPQAQPPQDALRRALMMQRPQMQGQPQGQPPQGGTAFQNAPVPGGPQMPGQMPPPQAPPGLLGLLKQQ